MNHESPMIPLPPPKPCGFNGDGKGRERLGAGKKEGGGEGEGRERESVPLSQSLPSLPFPSPLKPWFSEGEHLCSSLNFKMSIPTDFMADMFHNLKINFFNTHC